MSVLDVKSAGAASDSGPGPVSPPPARVLVVFELSASGSAALREAAELANAGCELTVVSLAPQARPNRCCRGGSQAVPFNRAVRDEAQQDLREARRQLGSVADRAAFAVLAGCPDPPLTAWVVEQGFKVVLLPSHRLTRAGGRTARSLRRETSADVRLVG